MTGDATGSGSRQDDSHVAGVLPTSRDLREVQDNEGSIVAALADPAFRNLWLAELLSQTALNAIWFAALVATEQETHSATKISFTVVSATVPVALFGILAGILVDRWDKKRVLLWSNLVRIAISFGYLWYGWSIGVIFLMNFLINTAAQFFSPAMLATIPRLLPKRLLTAATGLFNITLNISQVLGMVVLGPPLLKLVGPGVVFAAAGAIYVASTVLIVLLPGDRVGGAAEREGVVRERRQGRTLTLLGHDLREGWAFVRGDRLSWLAMVYLAATWTVLFSLITLAPRYAASRAGLRIESEDAVFILAPAGLGMGLAAGLLDYLMRRFGRWKLVGRSLLLLAASLLALALVAPVANFFVRHGMTHEFRRAVRLQIILGRAGVVMLISFVAGWWVGVVTVASEATLLERAPEELRGRVFALQLTFTNLASIVPLLAIGRLADTIGLNQVIAVTAAVIAGLWLVTAAPFIPEPADTLPAVIRGEASGPPAAPETGAARG